MKHIEDTLVWKAIVKTNQAILVITSISVMTILVAGVFVRYVLKSDIFGIEEILVICAMWMYWMAGVHASYQNNHLRADIFDNVIKSKKAKRIFSIAVQIITIFGIALFAKWGIDFAAWNIKVGSTTPGHRMPMLYSQIPITISFIMMLFYSLYHLYRTIFPIKPDNKEVSN